MADQDRSEIVDDIKELLDRLEAEVDEVATEGKAGVKSASTRAQEAFDSGKIQSKEKLGALRTRLDELEDELDEHVDRGKSKTADTIGEIRGKLRELENRLRD